MSLITEDVKHSVNTLEEVRKLQELVKKLEIQNLHLRNKQNAQSKRSVSPVKELKSQSPRKVSDPKTDAENSNNEIESSDELDIIKLSDIEMSDDESWLYESPKSSKEDHETSYEWLRKDVDDPNNKQLQLAKNALLSKVTELGIEGPTPKKYVDTRTFTRSKKKQTIEFLSRLDMFSNEKNEKHSSGWPRRGSDVSSDSLSSCHLLEDASDVEEVARMQEESLRNSSPLGTPKRGPYGSHTFSRKISLSSRGSASDQDLSESSPLGVPNSEDCPENELVENNSLGAELAHHSDQSSPSESPYNSNMSLHSNDKIQGKLSGYRRSLPNLNREPLAARQSKNSSTSDKTKLQNQKIAGRVYDTYIQSSEKTRREYTSPLRRPSNQRGSSDAETVTTVPKSAEISHIRGRSGLPRPSRASSASRSAARSGIPMPSMLSKKQEDSWSEGCF